jgi:hypothetical protein
MVGIRAALRPSFFIDSAAQGKRRFYLHDSFPKIFVHTEKIACHRAEWKLGGETYVSVFFFLRQIHLVFNDVQKVGAVLTSVCIQGRGHSVT